MKSMDTLGWRCVKHLILFSLFLFLNFEHFGAYAYLVKWLGVGFAWFIHSMPYYIKNSEQCKCLWWLMVKFKIFTSVLHQSDTIFEWDIFLAIYYLLLLVK